MNPCVLEGAAASEKFHVAQRSQWLRWWLAGEDFAGVGTSGSDAPPRNRLCPVAHSLPLPPHNPEEPENVGGAAENSCAHCPSPASSQSCGDLRILVGGGGGRREGDGARPQAEPDRPGKVSLCFISISTCPSPPCLLLLVPESQSQPARHEMCQSIFWFKRRKNISTG